MRQFLTWKRDLKIDSPEVAPVKNFDNFPPFLHRYLFREHEHILQSIFIIKLQTRVVITRKKGRILTIFVRLLDSFNFIISFVSAKNFADRFCVCTNSTHGFMQMMGEMLAWAQHQRTNKIVKI